MGSTWHREQSLHVDTRLAHSAAVSGAVHRFPSQWPEALVEKANLCCSQRAGRAGRGNGLAAPLPSPRLAGDGPCVTACEQRKAEAGTPAGNPVGTTPTTGTRLTAHGREAGAHRGRGAPRSRLSVPEAVPAEKRTGRWAGQAGNAGVRATCGKGHGGCGGERCANQL